MGIVAHSAAIPADEAIRTFLMKKAVSLSPGNFFVFIKFTSFSINLL
jgi:hypothetical protein